MAVVDVQDDGWTVICLHPDDAEELAETLAHRPWSSAAWNLAQIYYYERDRDDRKSDEIEWWPTGCAACHGREIRRRRDGEA